MSDRDFNSRVAEFDKRSEELKLLQSQEPLKATIVEQSLRISDLLRINNEFEERARKAERDLKAAIEAIACDIYETLPFVNGRGEPMRGTKPDWVRHGNGLKQDEARDMARAIIERCK